MSHHLEDEDPPQPIPRELYSEYEERPFRTCTRCGEGLADFEGGFQISKAFKNGECVFEYALCDHCRMAMMEEFSQESKQRLGNYQNDHMILDRGLDVCAVCGTSRLDKPMRDYVMTGVCDQNNLVHSLLMCGKCGDGVQELISKPTRDVWRGFVDENFPGPPSDALPEPEETHHPVSPMMAKI